MDSPALYIATDLLFQQLRIHPAIIINEEHILAVVPALRDMMGESL